MDLATTVLQLFEQYKVLNDAHPIVGGMITAQVIFPLADIASQRITDYTIDWKKVAYTGSLAPLYGAYSYLSVQSGEMVGNLLDDPLAKAALGPNLIGLLMCSFS